MNVIRGRKAIEESKEYLPISSGVYRCIDRMS